MKDEKPKKPHIDHWIGDARMRTRKAIEDSLNKEFGTVSHETKYGRARGW